MVSVIILWETYPFHDECAVSMRVVIVGRGRQRASGRSARRAAAVLRHRAQAWPVTELGTDRPTETNGMGVVKQKVGSRKYMRTKKKNTISCIEL